MARRKKKSVAKKTPCGGCLLCTGRTADAKLIPVLLRSSRPPLRLFVS